MQKRNLFLTLTQLLRWAGSQTMHHPWIFIHIGVKEEDPHGPVLGHHLPSPLTDEQRCCGKNADDPSGQDLHIRMCRTRTRRMDTLPRPWRAMKTHSHHVNKNWCTTSIPRPSRSSEDKPRAMVVILYISHLSESIRRILAPLKVRTCFRPHCILVDPNASKGPDST